MRGEQENKSVMEACRTNVALRNVLFATDFSEESAHAVPYLQSLRQAYGTEIHAVHVVDVFPYPLSDAAALAERAVHVREQAEVRLRDFMLAQGFERKQFQAAVLTGEIFEAVDSFVGAHHIDLIVLGSRGDLGIGRMFLGSTAEEIFRSAKCPVITIGPRASAPRPSGVFDRLLFATDLSRHSAAAVPYLEWLLEQNPSSTVTMLHVLPHQEHALEQQLALSRIEEQVLSLIAPELRGQVAGVIVKPGEPALAMVRAAAQIEADLLVLGLRYGGSFLRASTHSLWSLTAEVIGKAPCPVLTVRSSGPTEA